MAEPEEVLIDAARRMAEAAGRAWRRRREVQASDSVTFDPLRPRLQLLLAATWDTDIPIRAAQPPAPPTWLARLLRR